MPQEFVGGFNFEPKADGTPRKQKPLAPSKTKLSAAESGSESQHQQAFYQWCHSNKNRFPVLTKFFHVPNGGSRGGVKEVYSKKHGRMIRISTEAQRLVREGMRGGVLDNTLQVARRGFHSLWIEFKVLDNDLSDEQAEERKFLLGEGHSVHTVWVWPEAARLACWYLSIDPHLTIGMGKIELYLSRFGGHNQRCAGCPVKI